MMVVSLLQVHMPEYCVSVPGDEMRSSQLITHKYSTSVVCEREKAKTIKKKLRELWSFFIHLQCTYQYQQYLSVK